MTFLARFRIGNGTLPEDVREQLEAEGLVLLEERLRGSVRYDDFKAPGKRFHGKVTYERIAIGVSEVRFAIRCRSGSVKLIDSPFSEPRLHAVQVSAREDDELNIQVDYDQLDLPEISGRITIRTRTSRAAEIADQLASRIGL